MGRLEKQIITGAIALVAVLLVVVLVKGIDHKTQKDATERKPEWQDPALLLSGSAKAVNGKGNSQLAKVVDFTAEKQPKPNAGDLKSPGVISQENKSSLGEPAAGMPETSSGHLVSASTKALQNTGPKSAVAQAATKVNLDWDEGLHLYVVKENETLSEIAQNQVGSMLYLDSILELNEGLSANKVFPGQEIWLPSEESAKLNREQRRSAKIKGSQKKNQASSGTSERHHTVVSGDSLWRIARKYYPSVERNAAIQRIVKANSELKDENAVLELGAILSVPR